MRLREGDVMVHSGSTKGVHVVETIVFISFLGGDDWSALLTSPKGDVKLTVICKSKVDNPYWRKIT